MTDSKKILLSGVKPTGRPHVGNYFGAMKQFVELQDEYSTFVFIANYHALTSSHLQRNPEKLEEYTNDLVLDYLAIGIDPGKVTLFLQSDVPEIAELAWIFECIMTVPYLMRGHAYKDAIAKGKEVGAGVLNYPMLMAADILIQDADVVPVGKDQKQHIEFARDVAGKFNNLYGETFKLPEPLILDDMKTVPGIDGQKMSKSYNNTIPLFGNDEEIKKAVMSIVTDSKTPDDKKDPNEDNIFALHKLFSKEQLSDLEKRYRDGGIGYKESKDILLENIISFITPMREKREELLKDKDKVMKILKNGGEIARSRAKEKMIEVKKKVGLL